jgi:hypothetical protein
LTREWKRTNEINGLRHFSHFGIAATIRPRHKGLIHAFPAQTPKPCRKAPSDFVSTGRNGPRDERRRRKMKKERRWLKSVLAASLEPQPALPWQRGTRRRPEAVKTAAPAIKPRAIAAR